MLFDRLEIACETFSDKAAIKDGCVTYTYSDLYKNVNRISKMISNVMKGQTGNICVLMNKSFDYIASIFAIYKCHCTFVPIEKGLPINKVRYILCDANAILVLSDTEKMLSESVNWINLKTNQVSADKYTTVTNPHDCNVAYILYTSGTTGNPKGIEITHEAAETFIMWAQQKVSVASLDVFASHAPFSFDLSVFDIYCSLFNGALLVLMQRGINAFVKSVRKYILDNNITIWYSVPSIIIKLLEKDDGSVFKGLRVLIYAGEAMPYKYINKLIQLYPDLNIYNFYGPTETNVITYYEIEKNCRYCDEIPIGHSCPYAEISVVRDNGEVAKNGECGELIVKSKSLMKGYRNKPILGDTYFTGDVVQLIDKNYFSFLGRKDNMVKVNGFRVELEEIETVIESFSYIDSAIVKVIVENDVDVLSAFYTSKIEIDPAELRLFLATQLQSYKIPSRYEKIDSIKFTDRGKKIRNI